MTTSRIENRFPLPKKLHKHSLRVIIFLVYIKVSAARMFQERKVFMEELARKMIKAIYGSRDLHVKQWFLCLVI